MSALLSNQWVSRGGAGAGQGCAAAQLVRPPRARARQPRLLSDAQHHIQPPLPQQPPPQVDSYLDALVSSQLPAVGLSSVRARACSHPASTLPAPAAGRLWLHICHPRILRPCKNKQLPEIHTHSCLRASRPSSLCAPARRRPRGPRWMQSPTSRRATTCSKSWAWTRVSWLAG